MCKELNIPVSSGAVLSTDGSVGTQGQGECLNGVPVPSSKYLELRCTPDPVWVLTLLLTTLSLMLNEKLSTSLDITQTFIYMKFHLSSVLIVELHEDL